MELGLPRMLFNGTLLPSRRLSQLSLHGMDVYGSHAGFAPLHGEERAFACQHAGRKKKMSWLSSLGEMPAHTTFFSCSMCPRHLAFAGEENTTEAALGGGREKLALPSCCWHFTFAACLACTCCVCCPLHPSFMSLQL